MKLIKFILIFSICLRGVPSASQELLFKVPIEVQITNSSLIIEGRIISKESYWNNSYSKIFTINKIEVYKVFKGQSIDYIEIITPGGTVGLQAEIVIPSLDLILGDEGVFMLQATNQSLNRTDPENLSFTAYSDLQGFYKYNYFTNTAVNPFYNFEGIQDVFYNQIIFQTNLTPISVSDFNVSDKLQNNTQNRSTNNVTGISPTVASAGTKRVLTINGSGFAPADIEGTVSFPDANDGGATYFDALASQIISYTDTQIQVEIPSRAGTGQVRVNTFTGPLFTPVLMIEFAQLNVITDSATGIDTAYQTQHIDDNFIGGMTWQMHNELNNNIPARESVLRSFDTWVCTTGINWIIGGPSAVDVAEFDNINIIRFDNGSELPAGVLGRTTSYWNGCSQGPNINWFVAELDIVFDDETNWNFGPGAPLGNQVDFESVSVHELGHAHQLGHVIDNTKIMFWSAGAGSANRTLSEEDIAGANDVQSRSTSNPVCGQGVMTNSSCFLSVSDENLAQNILLFPNPANDILNINLRHGITLKDIHIYDLNGKLVLKYVVNSNHFGTNIQLSVVNFSSGMYFVELNGESAKVVKKLLID